VAEQHDHCPRTKLLVARATLVVFPASDLIARRQDLALFLKRIRHNFVRLQVAWRLQFLCGIYADPLPADAEVEECDQHLTFDLPGHFADSPGPPKILHVYEADTQQLAGKRVWVVLRIWKGLLPMSRST